MGTDRSEAVREALAELATDRPAAFGDRLDVIMDEVRVVAIDLIMSANEKDMADLMNDLWDLFCAWCRVPDPTPEETEARGEVTGIHRTLFCALQISVPDSTLREVTPGALPHQVLLEIARTPGCSNAHLSDALRVDKTQISRAARRLISANLVVRRRTGRRNAWEVTPKGLRALRMLPEPDPPTSPPATRTPRRAPFVAALI